MKISALKILILKPASEDDDRDDSNGGDKLKHYRNEFGEIWFRSDVSVANGGKRSGSKIETVKVLLDNTMVSSGFWLETFKVTCIKHQ